MNQLCRAILCFIICLPVYASSLQDSPEKGWLWYKEEKEKPKKPEEKKVPETPKTKPLSATEQVKQMREIFEEQLAVAVLNPTLENVTLVKNMQLEFEARSQVFSDAWVLSHIIESKGYSHGGNPHPWHQEMLLKEKEEQMSKKLEHLARSYGLFFAFKESCPYCHKFSPVVARFASKHGFQVKGISADGGTVEGIADISADNGALAKINPDGIYPALFLANPRTMEVIPIAWGMVTTDQLMNNLETVIKQMEIMQ